MQPTVPPDEKRQYLEPNFAVGPQTKVHYISELQISPSPIERLIHARIDHEGKTNDYVIAMNSSGAMTDQDIAICLGGLRFREFSSFDEQCEETISLAGRSGEATGMAAKYRCIGLLDETLVIGGGKSTVDCSSEHFAKEKWSRTQSDFFKAIGWVIWAANRQERVRYFTAEDIGTNAEMMVWIRDGLMDAARYFNDDIEDAARCVTLLPEDKGGYGDPSPYTALGVHRSIIGAAQALGIKIGDDTGVMVHGCGACGSEVAKLLVGGGVRNLWLSDGNPNKYQAWNHIRKTADKLPTIPPTGPETGYGMFLPEARPAPRVIPPTGGFPHFTKHSYGYQDIKVIVPCGAGRTCNDQNLKIVKYSGVRLICGSENIIWQDPETDPQKWNSDACVVPAELSNLLGAYLAALEVFKRPKEEAAAAAEKLSDLVKNLVTQAVRVGVPPYQLLMDRIGPNT